MKRQPTHQLSAIAVLALSITAPHAMAGTLGETDLWAGPYIGAYFGGGSGNVDTTYHASTATSSITRNNAGTITASSTTQTTAAGQLNGKANGSLVDLFVGYNFHRSHSQYLLGAQLEGSAFSDITVKASGVANETINSASTIPTPFNSTSANLNLTQGVRNDLRSMLSVIGRAGILAQPNTLIYGLVGPTEGHFVLPEVVDVGGIVSTSPNTVDRNQWQLGMSAGAGIEHKFNMNWSIIAEYRYIHFKVDNSGTNATPTYSATSSSNTNGTNTLNFSTSNQFDINVGTIGIVYKI